MQRIDEQHVGAQVHQAAGQVAADEAQAAGDQDAAAPVELAVGDAHGAATCRPAAGAAAPAGTSRAPAPVRRAARHHDQLHHRLQHVRRPDEAAEVEELRAAVGAVVVVHRHLGDAEAGVV